MCRGITGASHQLSEKGKGDKSLVDDLNGNWVL